MKWKLIAVISISLILLFICYLTIINPLPEGLIKKYFKNENQNQIQIQSENQIIQESKKIKIDFSNQENFNNFIKDNIDHNYYNGYYFPEECPSYKLEYFLIENNENNENYYVPEKGYMIIIKKEHTWTKEPTFTYWKYQV